MKLYSKESTSNVFRKNKLYNANHRIFATILEDAGVEVAKSIVKELKNDEEIHTEESVSVPSKE
jgi:hypothetical protein